MTPPNVVLLSLHFAEYSAALARAMAARATVHLILYRDNADNELGLHRWRELAQNGLMVTALERPRSPQHIWRNATAIASTLKAVRPDVLHIQEAWRDETLLSWPAWRSIPMLLTVHDPLPHAGRDAQRMRRSRHGVYRRLLRNAATAAITHGDVLARQLAVDSPRLDGRIHLAVHGPLGGPVRNMPDSSDAPIRLLFFGRIEAYKGLRHFVDAVIALRAEGLPVLGVVAGRGDDLASQRLRMEQAGCFDIRDRFIPTLEVETLFAEASALVLPYVEGTQSGVAAMALGFGRPVIATRVGAIPDLVHDGFNGLLVPPGDSAALATAVRSFVGDGGLRMRLASGAVQLAAGDMSWARAADETVAVYSRLVTGARR